MKRVILPGLATVLVVGMLSGILIARAHTSSDHPAWTTYTDPLRLYTISYPGGWKASGGIATSGMDDGVSMAGISDGVRLADSTDPTMIITISAIEVTSPTLHAFYCHPNDPSGFDFHTGNAYIQFSTGLNQDYLHPLFTPVPAATAQTRVDIYRSIRSTFKSLAPKGSSC